MPRYFVIAVAVLVALGLLAFTMTYTVRFTEAAVVTTFGKAAEGGTRTDPGLGFKLPYPIQAVTKYDTRARFLDVRLEQQQTADDRQIAVKAFCLWRVKDPLTFFQRHSNAGETEQDHYDAASSFLRNNLRSALSETSRYRLDQLFVAAGAGASALPELEGRVLDTLRRGAAGAQSLDAYGIEVVSVGIHQIEFPEATTRIVFERMGTDREALVKALESEGESQASAIVDKAKSEAQIIRDFAVALASIRRAIGDREAAPWIGRMADHPELAIFLRNLDLMRETFAKRVTFVFPLSNTPGLRMLDPSRVIGRAPDEVLRDAADLSGALPGAAAEPGPDQPRTGREDGR